MTKTIDSINRILNIAAYKFVELDDLPTLRTTLRAKLEELEIKGTILLSTEGVNMFLAGEPTPVREFLAYLRGFEPLKDLEAKESFSDSQPFNRTLVRLKREIIAFGVDGIEPAKRASPKISAEQLRTWLDEGKELTLLDVRNDYEIELGTFTDAKAIGVDNFREFPDAVRELPEELKEKPVVMFCTGGIRCEKAGPFMEREGFETIYQLDGGILKYFETCGSQHYDGDCFVFDQRVSVDPALEETDTDMCFACQATLSPEEQASPFYIAGKSCPNCYQPPEQSMQEVIDERHRRLAELIDPLPGSYPQDNFRPISVSQKCEGSALIDLLDRAHPHVGRDVWQQRCDEGLLQLEGVPVDSKRIVCAGERYQHLLEGDVEPDVNANIEIIHEDDSIVVVNKPAPLPMHPSGRFKRNSLTKILSEVYHPHQLRIAHRLDANTTGVVVLSRTKSVAREIQPQFEQGLVSKTYLALVHGRPEKDQFECEASISSVPSQAGLRTVSEKGLQARTEFRVLAQHENTTLLEVTPKTGRTNQIRVHLWHLNIPIVGDPGYLPNQELGKSQTLGTADDPMCLHAWKIRFLNVPDKEEIEMVGSLPAWADEALR